MNLFKAFANVIPINSTYPAPAVRPVTQNITTIPSGLSLYPTGKDGTFINKGYKGNAWVYAIVSKCAKKFGQVPFYHYKIKRSERKAWFDEYLPLSQSIRDDRARIEMKKIRTKAVDQVVVDDDISKLLKKANRNQTGAQFREQLYGFKLLTGEGNTWLSRDERKPPKEMFIIPKSCLALVLGSDPWDIAKYKLLFAGNEFTNDKEDIIMWKFPNYDFDVNTLSHLRGMAPLDAGLLLLQSTNEGQERLAAMNKNQGVAGMVVNEGATQTPTVEQALFMRQQFNSIVNDKDLAGTIAYMTGKLSFLQFGMDAGQLQLLEQLDRSIEWFCNIFDYPPGLMTKNQTHENQRQQERAFIYNNIAVAAYSLRDEYNEKLIPLFGLDRERDVIDCDIMALPELSEDMKTQAETLSKLWQLTPNQQLEYLGYDKSTDKNMDKVYIPSNLTPLDEVNTDLGNDLEEDVNLLGDNN